MNLSPLFFSFLLILTANSYAQSIIKAHWQEVNYIEQSFYEIALQNEYDAHETQVRKWNKPLNVYIKHEVGDKALHLRTFV